MGHPINLHSDVLRDVELADALTALREDPTRWRTAEGAAVLAEARHRFSRLAVKCGLDEDDGATHAWTYWTQEMTDAQLGEHRGDLWKYTGAAIAKQMVAECTAQNRLTSTRALRQVAVVGMDAPVRFNSAEELASVSATTLMIDPFDEPEQVVPERSLGRRQAMAAVHQLLVLAGLTQSQRDLIIDELARHVDTAVNIRAAGEAMRRSPTPAVPIGQERWKAMVTLVLGTAKGTPGIMQLVGQGHPAPMSEPHIQKLLSVFLQKTPAVAAGVA